MRSVTATLVVNIDAEENDTDDDMQEVAREVMIDLLHSGCEITISE